MGVRFACHGCGKHLNIKNDLAGKRGKCPACNLRFRIPLGDQEFSIPLESDSGQDDDADGGDSLLPAVEPGAAFTQAAARSAEPQATTSPTHRQAGTAVEEGGDFDIFADQTAQWYVRPPSGGRYGPADSETLRQWVREGRITADTLLWRDGWPEWRGADQVLPPMPSATKTAAVTPPPPTPISPAPLTPSPSATNGGGGLSAPLKTTSATAPLSQTEKSVSYEGDSYLGAKRRKKARQRTIVIGVLIAASVILVLALVAALMWSPEPEPELGYLLPRSVLQPKV